MTPININFEPFPVQITALDYLFDKKTTEIFFGGAARVSKTYLACAFAVISCLQSPGIHVGMGRSRLTYLKKTTLLTLFEFIKHQNLIEGEHFTFNRQENILTFFNGSKILFLELYDNPSDPSFERLLSLSLTHCVIDECSQVSKKAYETISTRISYKLKEYDITGKLLIVSNPTKGWLYDEFYLPYKDNKLSSNKAVILGLPTDNPTAGEEYVKQQLEILSEPMAQRLIYGNWDYAEEDYSVYKLDDIIECFYNDSPVGEYYLSADIADIGGDRTVITIWNGLNQIKTVVREQTTDKTEDEIKKLMKQYKIPVKNVVIDADGVGVGVANRLKGCYKFKNNSKAINNENYKNLKTQCIMVLKEYVDGHGVTFDAETREDIIKEMQQIRYDSTDREQMQIEPKSKLKQRYGKSPDIFDSIMMRFVFFLKRPVKFTIIN